MKNESVRANCCVGVFVFLLCLTQLSVAQGLPTTTAPDWAGRLNLGSLNFSTLVPADDPVMTAPGALDPATDNPAHLPPGGKFKLFGAAKDDYDPENPFNEVISFDTTDPAAVAGAIKLFGDHVKIDMLDNQVELKYLYVGRDCGGGSTRFQLAIDRDGDGKSDGNAFGYVGDKPFGGTCVTGQWTYEDMTNSTPKWDLTQLGAPCGFVCTWQQMETFLSAFPNHRVLNEVLVDDSQSFFPADTGCAYFDVVSAGARTLTRHDDTGGNGSLPNHC